ncbi:MAG: hypothetical protein AB8B79_14110 [Granulosicoccus sp.]
MIDALTSPGMAIDIRLSTQEPIQQLGARLANILSGELSRMRADIAFAAATGITVHSATGQAELLRAQQSAVLGHHQLSLTAQAVLHAESALRTRTNDADLEENWQTNDEGRGSDQDHSDSEEGHEDDEPELECNSESVSASTLHQDELLINALKDALQQFHSITREQGISGNPIAVVLPAKHWIDNHAPLNVRQAIVASESDRLADVMVLCLAFDGQLADDHVLWGYIYRQDVCVGSMQGLWLAESALHSQRQWEMTVTDPESMVSALHCRCTDSPAVGAISGVRIRIDNSLADRAPWSWQVTEWIWK